MKRPQLYGLYGNLGDTDRRICAQQPLGVFAQSTIVVMTPAAVGVNDHPMPKCEASAEVTQAVGR
jgi:hypothetical protein